MSSMYNGSKNLNPKMPGTEGAIGVNLSPLCRQDSCALIAALSQ